jgi:hypothetical protein
VLQPTGSAVVTLPAKDGDAVEASNLVTAAMSLSAGNPIASVMQRSYSFVQASGKWQFEQQS